MLIDFLLASGHHIALLLMTAVLAAEALLLRQAPHERALGTLGRLDLVYGLSAGVILIFGLARLSAGVKGIEFYSGNPVFWIKMTIIAAIGLISIVPTIRFIRWRRAFAGSGNLPEQLVWTQTRKLAMLQLLLMPLAAIAAAAMARGIGH